MTTKYVNTGSEAGGDGTTNNTTGDTRAYATLSEAEANLPATLTDAWTLLCEGTTADGSVFTIGGTTTSASNTLTIKTDTDHRHLGEYSTSYYRLTGVPAANSYAIQFGSAGYYLTFEGIQIELTHPADWSIRQIFNSQYAGTVNFDRCIFKVGPSSGAAPIIAFRVSYASNPGTWVFQSCGFLSAGTAAATCKAITEDNNTGTGAIYVYNCTFKSYKLGVQQSALTVAVANCGFVSCTDDLDGTITATTNSTSTPTFASGKEFHLDAADTTWLDEGTDLSEYTGIINTLDLDGQNRGATWDIGADEYVSSSTPLEVDELSDSLINRVWRGII